MSDRWDRQSGETSKAYSHFQMYRDLGVDRSFARLMDNGKVTVKRRQVERWSSRYRWVERCEAYISSVVPGEDSHSTRKAQVLAEWIEAGRLGPPNSPEAKQRIALLTSTTAANKKLDIELLNARLAIHQQ